MTTQGPISVPSPTTASGATTALGWMPGTGCDRRVQQRGDPGEAEIGLRRDQRDGTRRHLVGEGLQQYHRAGLGLLPAAARSGGCRGS